MKRDDKLFSIGEIAKALGVTRRIILHYEERGLIEPDKRDDATNNRYYTIDTFTKLRSIRSLQNLGLTLDEIRDYYNDSTDLMPLIRRMEEMRDQLNLNIEKLYERAKVSSAQVKELELPQQLIYRRAYRSNNVADKTVLLRNTALEAMRAHGTDITRRMYFIQFPIDRPAEVSFCVAVPPGSEGEYVETTAPMRAICIYHHGAYEELPAVGRQLLDYAKEHGLTPQGILRHTYLEGPPQHKDPAKFITQVILPIV
ncbi:MerR family transcriptional regulator [Dysosmobacter sp.]|jgi:DNA-binding transcriptional MerR regulator|uniref:MerR family transcriptional regulator n=1 Tax=Dysosmobacter sp. TaxID=2591382 RepID=UPI003AB1EB21